MIFSFKSGKADQPTSIPNLILVLVVGTAATAIFWLRAWIHMPGGWFAHFPLDIFVYAFWWPGVLYATILRHPDEGLIPSSRKRFFQNTGVGFVAGLAGILVANICYENHRNTAAEVQLFEEVNQIVASLHDHIHFDYDLRDETIFLSFNWDEPIAESNYEALREIRRLTAQSARLVSTRIPRSVDMELKNGERRFAHLVWGPERRGNPWNTLELDFEIAGLDSLPNQSDFSLIVHDGPATGILDDFQVSMDERKLAIFWNGDENILDSADGVIKMSDYWTSINRLITELRMHFSAIDGFDIQIPGIDLTLTVRQATRTMFRAQRFLPFEETVFLRMGEILDKWDKPSRLDAHVYIVGYDNEFERHHLQGVWPFMPEKINGYIFYLIEVDRVGEVKFVVVPEDETLEAEGPVTLYSGESLEVFGLQIENMGGGHTEN